MATSEIVIGPPVNITGRLARHEIVKRVVSTFIEHEFDKKGKGIRFKYPVENVGGANTIYISRPGKKKNFDFKVEVTETHEVGAGKHIEVMSVVRTLRQEDLAVFNAFWDVLTLVYKCEETSVEKAAKRSPVRIPDKYLEIIKILKWMFIMEDIHYWDNEGRAFLYNALNYCVGLPTGEEPEEYNDPEALKRKMKKMGEEWVSPE